MGISFTEPNDKPEHIDSNGYANYTITLQVRINAHDQDAMRVVPSRLADLLSPVIVADRVTVERKAVNPPPDTRDQEEGVYTWSDSSALWELKYWQTILEDKRKSAETYLRLRLNGLSQDQANDMLPKTA